MVSRAPLTGLLACGLCGRRLEAHWVHGWPGYRCRHGHTSAHRAAGRPRSIYWPERRILAEVLHELARRGALPPSAGAEDLVVFLRSRDAVIICNAAQLTIEEHAGHDPSPETGDILNEYSAAPPSLGERRTAEFILHACLETGHQ